MPIRLTRDEMQAERARVQRTLIGADELDRVADQQAAEQARTGDYFAGLASRSNRAQAIRLRVASRRYERALDAHMDAEWERLYGAGGRDD